MPQEHKPAGTQPPNPLLAPLCQSCGGATRLVELEPAAGGTPVDVCTYECQSCGTRQTREIPRSAGG
jgi:hypothetical protein